MRKELLFYVHSNISTLLHVFDHDETCIGTITAKHNKCSQQENIKER